jgi:ribosomal protein S18 acetylase RimI-like enzyme
VWLEVDRSNTAAWMLYAGLGLREHHRCRYLQQP